jgi:uncharacterized membrane protein
MGRIPCNLVHFFRKFSIEINSIGSVFNSSQAAADQVAAGGFSGGGSGGGGGGSW